MKLILASKLTFPPLISGHEVGSDKSAFTSALRGCDQNSAGAGDLFWSSNEAVLDVSVVLEPECKEHEALQMLFVAMVAFGDSFGAIAPPEIGVHYQWPNEFRISGASVGRARVAVSDANNDGMPEWLVVGIEVRVQPYASPIEPGRDLLRTTLWDEGASELDSAMLIESFARHLLTWIHNWGEDGFKPVHDAWLARAQGYEQTCEITWQNKTHKGKFLSIDEQGGLLLKNTKTTVALPIAPIVERTRSAK